MNKRENKIFAVIPAYNESQKVASVITELQKRGLSVIVVDDGSTDDTYMCAKNAGAYTYKHLLNIGQGAALQTGIDIALDKGADVILTYDADEQFDPNDIRLLITRIEKGDVDVVLGSRFLKVQHVPFIRKVLLKLAIVFTRITTGLSVSDTHNGLRAFTRKAAESISITQPRMAHASEILLEISDHALTYAEVPVTIHYTEYSVRKGQKTSDSIRILVDLMFRK